MRRRGHMSSRRKQFVRTIRQVYVEPTYILIIVPSLVRARTEYFPTQGFVSVSCLSHTRKRNGTENSLFARADNTPKGHKQAPSKLLSEVFPSFTSSTGILHRVYSQTLMYSHIIRFPMARISDLLASIITVSSYNS